MSRGPEVLAPAGSMDALRAAVECGADAVYLGAGHFNARRNARNFTEEELAEAIEYCHVRGVKVHLTLNTLVSDEELPLAIDLIESACSLGVDALIVQDLGVAALVRAAGEPSRTILHQRSRPHPGDVDQRDGSTCEADCSRRSMADERLARRGLRCDGERRLD